MEKGILGSDVICQIGILVNDVHAAGKAYADFFGVECPPVVTSGDPERVKGTYNGEPSDATCKMMFFDLDNIQLELIEPDEKPSVWRDDLNARGEGPHHIAFQVKDNKGMVKKLESKGFSLRQAGDYGDNSGCYSYVDTRSALKMTIELLESYL